jgi:hypothetical protein
MKRSPKKKKLRKDVCGAQYTDIARSQRLLVSRASERNLTAEKEFHNIGEIVEKREVSRLPPLLLSPTKFTKKHSIVSISSPNFSLPRIQNRRDSPSLSLFNSPTSPLRRKNDLLSGGKQERNFRTSPHGGYGMMMTSPPCTPRSKIRESLSHSNGSRTQISGGSRCSSRGGTDFCVRIDPVEVYTQEWKDGDVPVRYFMTVPNYAVAGLVIENVGGRKNLSIKIPETVFPGETIVIIAPCIKKKIRTEPPPKRQLTRVSSDLSVATTMTESESMELSTDRLVSMLDKIL